MDEPVEARILLDAAVATTVVGLALVVAPTSVAVPVLVALAALCALGGGREAGLVATSVSCFLFGYAITEPHFEWEITDRPDEVLLIVLFVASLVVIEVGARLRLHRRARRR